MNQKVYIAMLLFCCSLPVRAEDTPLDGPDEVPSEAQATAAIEDEKKAIDPVLLTEVLNIGLRMDPGFAVGSPVQQGFTLNSARVSLFGEMGLFDYRFSLGQTREFSGALLPQMTPVEAYLQASLLGASGPDRLPAVEGQIGMFTPTFHPLWSPDLSDVDVIDYSLVHREILLGRDLGAEVRFSAHAQSLVVGAGTFNGSGITAINSNNTKVFTGFVRKKWGEEGNAVQGALGFSGYLLLQSTPGSINHKSNSIQMLYGELALFHSQLKLMGEFYNGTFEDSTRLVDVFGGAVTAWIRFNDGIRLFTRFETLSAAPVGGGLGIRHLVMGPIFDLSEHIKLFAHFDYSSYSNQASETQLLVRFRLNL